MYQAIKHPSSLCKSKAKIGENNRPDIEKLTGDITPSLSLLFDQIRFEEKSIIKAAKAKGIKLTLLDARKLCVDLNNRSLNAEVGDVVLQRCVSFFRALHLTALLEYLGAAVINSHKVLFVCGNKVLTTLALCKAGVPTPKTTVSFTRDTVLKLLEERGYNAVLKPVVGSWGRLIAPLKDRESAEAILEAREFMHPLYHVYYVQEIIPRPPRDIRVTVIGEEAVAAIYRKAPPGEWRTSIARGGRAERCELTSELKEISLKAAEAVGGGILGVDIMEGQEGYVVHEVNHTIEFAATVATTRVDIPGLIVDYTVRQARK